MEVVGGLLLLREQNTPRESMMVETRRGMGITPDNTCGRGPHIWALLGTQSANVYFVHNYLANAVCFFVCGDSDYFRFSFVGVKR